MQYLNNQLADVSYAVVECSIGCLEYPNVEIRSSLTSFLACVQEYICERESRRFEVRLNTKVKLDITFYKRFGKSAEMKKHLHGLRNEESRLY